jgi:NADH-quinone oxidoreductase subunit J
VIDVLVANFALIVFCVLATLAIAGAVGVILARNPVHAALALLGTFLAVAGLFFLQHAEFIAAVQILVYAGGVMVLFLFVIMLVNVHALPAEPQYLRKLAPWAVAIGLVLTVLVGVGMWAAVVGKSAAEGAALVSVEGQTLGNTEAVGWELYVRYLLPFEVVSVVLLVAMIGAIVMGRKDTPTERQA